MNKCMGFDSSSTHICFFSEELLKPSSVVGPSHRWVVRKWKECSIRGTEMFEAEPRIDFHRKNHLYSFFWRFVMLWSYSGIVFLVWIQVLLRSWDEQEDSFLLLQRHNTIFMVKLFRCGLNPRCLDHQNTYFGLKIKYLHLPCLFKRSKGG